MNVVVSDPLPDAPQLAPRGSYHVGVQTLNLVKPNAIDFVHITRDNPEPRYDRPLTVEVWYPAIIPPGKTEQVFYEDYLGRSDRPEPLVPFTFEGRALRDAPPDPANGPYPLVIVSHGFLGSRYLMTYLTENLASKGYVVVAIDHTDSTYTDAGPFASTLLNRATDQLFVLDAIAKASVGNGFLGGLVDAEHTAVIGYSMGGYGALNVIGAGYNDRLGRFVGPAVQPRLANNPDYFASLDKRVKVAVLFAPWGSDLQAFGSPGVGFWDDTVMENITVPTLWIAGTADDVAGYEGIVRLFNHALNSERYLLTYDKAGHNVAPNPPPVEAVRQTDYDHYADPVWDERRINNVNQHMLTAFLGVYLRGDNDLRAYLTPPAEKNADLLGFPQGTTHGIELRSVPAQ